MNLRSERGAVLVAGLLVLVLLTLLGLSSLMTASIETKILTNQRGSKRAFYAAEATLDAAAGRIMSSFQATPLPFTALPTLSPDDTTHNWVTVTDAMTGGSLTGGKLNGFDLDFTVVPLDNAGFPGAATRIDLDTTENGQSMRNLVWTFLVTGRAVDSVQEDMEQLSETLQIIERPLTQYFAYYAGDPTDPAVNGDMCFRPQTTGFTLRGGRIFATGDLYLGPGEDMIFDFADAATGLEMPIALNAGGEILYDELSQSGGPAGSSPGGSVTVRFPQVSAATPPADVTIDSGFGPDSGSILKTNRAMTEFSFLTAPGSTDSLVRTGVDTEPVLMNGVPASRAAIATGGIYSDVASGVTADAFDKIYIDINGGSLRARLWIDGGVSGQIITDRLNNYEVNATPTLVNFFHAQATWQNGSRTRADGSIGDGVAAGGAPTPLMLGSIIYSPEAQVTTDPLGGTYPASVSNRATPGELNPYYPAYLETQDPREGSTDVDFTVIDLQRLQMWYKSYLIQNGIEANSAAVGRRQLMIYATRDGASGTGAGIQAIKLIGSRAARHRNGSSTQQDATTQVPTTIVSDGPIYIDGDFNRSGTRVGGEPTMIISDAVTVLSNNWGNLRFGQIGGAGSFGAATAASETVVNAAFFTGRSVAGGGVAAGVEDLLRFMEDWDGIPFHLTGTLSSLWASGIATGAYNAGAAWFNPPLYDMGWDERFQNLVDPNSPQPPWIPTLVTMERESWHDR